jgi:hypothetical protein
MVTRFDRLAEMMIRAGTRRHFLGLAPAALAAFRELRVAGAKEHPSVITADDGSETPRVGHGRHGKKDEPAPPGDPIPLPPPGPGESCGPCQTDADCIEEGTVCGAVDGVCGPAWALCAGKFWDCFNHRTLVCPEDGGAPHCRLGRHDFRRRRGRLPHRGEPFSFCFGTGEVCIPSPCPPE